MEDDLISRESVLKLIEDIKINPDIPKNYGTLMDIMRGVREIPAAFDVDKVVEEIREYADNVAELGGNFLPKVVIKIVKSGGID